MRCQLCCPPLNLRRWICLQTLEIKVQQGWKDGTKITFPGKGDEVPGRPPADLVFVVKQLPHPLFERKGNDLHLKVTITLKQAIGGGGCPCEQAMPTGVPCLCSCMAGLRAYRVQSLVWEIGAVCISDVQGQPVFEIPVQCKCLSAQGSQCLLCMQLLLRLLFTITS